MTALRLFVYGLLIIWTVAFGFVVLLAFAGWIAEAWRTHRARVARHNELLRRVQARRASRPHGTALCAPRAVPAQGRTAPRHGRGPAPSRPAA